MNINLPLSLSYRLVSLILTCCLLITYSGSAQWLATSKKARNFTEQKKMLLAKDALHQLETKFGVTFGYAPDVLANRYTESDEWSQANWSLIR